MSVTSISNVLHQCNIRLTDFGESWGNISHTSQIIRTHTNNIYKGTPAFVTPEVIDPNKRPAALKEEQLGMLGMLLFCLVNQDCQVPYVKEASQTNKKDWNDYLVGKISSGTLPADSIKYEGLHATLWLGICDAFLCCIKITAFERSSLETVKQTLEIIEDAMDLPFDKNQGTALLQAQDNSIITGAFHQPTND